MKTKFSFRIAFGMLLMALSLFLVLIITVPFFTKTGDLGIGFFDKAGDFLQDWFGFFPANGRLARFSLIPTSLFLFYESYWFFRGFRKRANYVKIILLIPLFLTLQVLFLKGQGLALPGYLDKLEFLSNKWKVAILLMGEVAVFALITSLITRIKMPSKRKNEKVVEKKVEVAPEVVPLARKTLETQIPVFRKFSEVETKPEEVRVPENKAEREPEHKAEIGMQSSVSLGVYDVVRREAEILKEKASRQSKWANFQPGNLSKKVAEDEKALKTMLEMERRVKEKQELEKRLAQEAAAKVVPEPVVEIKVETEEIVEKTPIVEAEKPIVVETARIEESIVEIEKPRTQVEKHDESFQIVTPDHTVIAPAPTLKEDNRNGWNTEKEEDYDLFSGVGGLGHADGSNSYLLNKQDLLYLYPSRDLLKVYPKDDSTEHDEETLRRGHTIVDTLSQFRVECRLSGITKGPTVTMYELTLAPGVKVSAISGLTDNIAMDLAVSQVRLLTPIPGKQAIGVEVPNFKRETIGFAEIVDSLDTQKMKIPMVLGKKITGESVAMDLASAPHVLIAGATGSGKSVCVNSMICSILYTKTPKEVRMIMVDPKIVELKIYNGIPHLLTPVITDPKKAIKAMQFCLEEMDRRYHVIGSVNVRNIAAYNEKIVNEHLAREKMPYIVVIMDEFADLMAVAGKELENLLHRLSAMARAVGIHLVFATQRPSAEVVTGLIKNNLPTKIAFSVTNQVNSKIILDCTGAEKLLGKGDMLYATSSIRDPERIQGAFLSDPEVEAIAAFVKTQGKPDYLDESLFEDDEPDDEEDFDEESSLTGDDAIYEKALKIVTERQSASASYLQRRLSIGYNKAARLVERMEDEGLVGPARGSKPRELLRFPD